MQRKDDYTAIRQKSNELSRQAREQEDTQQLKKAAELYEQSIALRLQIPNISRSESDIRSLDENYWALSDIYEKLDMPEKAYAAVKNARNMLFEFKQFPSHPNQVDNLYFEGQYNSEMSKFALKLGKDDSALKYATRAVEHFELFDNGFTANYDANSRNLFAINVVRVARLSGGNMQDAYVRALGILGNEHTSNDYLRKAYNTALLEITSPHKQQDKKREREAAKPSSTAGTTFNKNPGAKKKAKQDAINKQQPEPFHMTLRSRK